MVCARLASRFVVLAASCSAILALGTPAAASTPALAFAGAKRINILCNVAGGPGIDHVALTRELCAGVERLARIDSPLPVQTIALGDPHVLAADAVTLLVHGSVTPHRGDRLMALSIRPYRVSTEQASVLFGSAPRAAVIPRRSSMSRGLNSVISEALSETLPWRFNKDVATPLGRRR